MELKFLRKRSILVAMMSTQVKPEFCKAKFARRAAGQNLEEILRFRRGNPGILRARICA